MLAFADGRKVEYSTPDTNDWYPTADLKGIGEHYLYRPKAGTKMRPWSKPEDVPGPVCYIQLPGTTAAHLITTIGDEGLYIGLGHFWSWKELSNCKASTDRKTWHKCEVTE